MLPVTITSTRHKFKAKYVSNPVSGKTTSFIYNILLVNTGKLV